MPRDDWAKARAKDAAKRGKKKPQPRHKNQTRRPRHTQPRCHLTNAWSENSVLWFGIHKNTPVREVPRDYLKWLLNSDLSKKSWRIANLCNFLRAFLAGPPSRPAYIAPNTAHQRPRTSAPQSGYPPSETGSTVESGCPENGRSGHNLPASALMTASTT